MIGGRRTSDNLPNELVKTARTFFDRLSPNGSPILYHDFAIRWPEFQGQRRSLSSSSSDEQFPVTFLDCLRRVTPNNGMLTFERFCAGLRLALAEERANQNSKQAGPIFGRQQILSSASTSPYHNNGNGFGKLPTPPLRSCESVEKTKQLRNVYGSTQSMTSGQHTVNGHHPGHSQPPPYDAVLSRSRLQLDQDQTQKNPASTKLNALLARSTPQLCEAAIGHNEKQAGNGQHMHHQQLHRKVSIQNAALKNAQHQNGRPSSVQSTDTNGSLEGIRFREKAAMNLGQPAVVLRNGPKPRPVAYDTRRHTMIEGSESSPSQSKHMRLMQEEKELLKKAVDTAQRLYNWYNERLSSLETREKLVGKSMIPVDFAVHEEKLNYLRAHITEVNRRAVALMESSDKGFPWHMNLELHRSILQPADDQLMWLKRQNKMLTNEVAEKSERIGQLESEKSRLLKQLCESSSFKSIVHPPTPYINCAYPNASSGTDSGFHSLTHHSPPAPPLPPPNGQHASANGQYHQHSQHSRGYTPSVSNVIYATPALTNNDPVRYREPVPPLPPQHQRLYAGLAPTERQQTGILATLM